MRSSCRSVCFLPLMDSKLPPRVGRAWRPIRRVPAAANKTARCSLPDHDSNNCSSTTPKCYNCTGEHPAYFKSCPRYKHEKEIQTVKITKNISCPEARKIVNDRNPEPGLSYSAAFKSTPISDKKANPPAENDSIVVKKSDWLALLAIKKSWEEISSPSSNSQNLNNQTISSVVQPTVVNPTIRNFEPQTNTPTNSCIANASDQTRTNSDTPLSINSSSPIKRITKQSRENKKQEKKSNEWVKVKETKAAKRARLLAEKREQVFSHSLPNRSFSREDFLKDSVKEGKNNDDDSLLKVYPSDDDMSTGEVEDLLLSP
ncbi:hypothetical protein AVEN_26384-1 [Araneus ventricosus]|uniref:CCHC-type domain-containing protein n=1 Tax=Araneus ventricosus TaxID=182803 RepID=A0A4Y2UXV2_ARAVE|nr:hypothetical protein AVEN_26384-1 [Araneus ventricosus]